MERCAGSCSYYSSPKHSINKASSVNSHERDFALFLGVLQELVAAVWRVFLQKRDRGDYS